MNPWPQFFIVNYSVKYINICYKLNNVSLPHVRSAHKDDSTGTIHSQCNQNTWVQIMYLLQYNIAICVICICFLNSRSWGKVVSYASSDRFFFSRMIAALYYFLNVLLKSIFMPLQTTLKCLVSGWCYINKLALPYHKKW